MLTNAEQAAFRQTLHAMLREKSQWCGEMAETNAPLIHPQGPHSLPERPENQGDSHAEEVEQEIDLAIMANEQASVQEIEDAMRRLNEGLFGVCTVCQQPIAMARLRAIPATRYCITCAGRFR